MDLKSYFDFAENDYQYIKQSLEYGMISNTIAHISQNICERYMKSVIDVLYSPKTIDKEKAKESILRTHSLNKLYKFIEKEIPYADYSPAAKLAMNVIDGFYFSMRYPGDDSTEADRNDMEYCIDALFMCRNQTIERLQSDIAVLPEKDDKIVFAKNIQRDNDIT